MNARARRSRSSVLFVVWCLGVVVATTLTMHLIAYR